MSPKNSQRIPRYWKGIVSGTNRGPVTIRFANNREMLQGKAIVNDLAFGPTVISFEGKLNESQAQLKLHNFKAAVPFHALTGSLSLIFDDTTRGASGNWQTDIGTNGKCDVYPSGHSAGFSWFIWLYSLLSAHLKIFWKTNFRAFYLLLLLAVAVFDLFRIDKISYPGLILLLLPAPYIFRHQILETLMLFRITKIGPLEISPQQLLTDEIRQAISSAVQETMAYLVLDKFFVPATKVIMLWLAGQSVVEEKRFDEYAATLGVLGDNLSATKKALIDTQCVSMTDSKIQITPLGAKYAAHVYQSLARKY